MAIEIKCNGSVIASLESNQIATLKCKGLKMKEDVVVSVPELGTSEEKTVTPTKSTQIVKPTVKDYLSQVTVKPIPSEYLVPSGNEVVTKNGNYDVTDKKTVTVSIPIFNDEIDICDICEISFMIGDAAYHAEPDISWEEWCDGEHNTGSFSVNEANGYIWNGSRTVCKNDNSPVDNAEKIIDGAVYKLNY